MSSKEMSETEMEVMQFLWEVECPQSLGQLLEHFNSVCEKNWKPQTVSTFLSRMVKKNLLAWHQQGRAKVFTPICTKQEYEGIMAKSFIDKLYAGSVQNFMVALNENKSLSEKDIAELKKWLDSK